MVLSLDPKTVRRVTLAALLAIPTLAAADSTKFTKTVNDSAHAMAGCWPDGTTNFSDDGPGTYVWELTVGNDDVIAQIIAASGTAEPAVIVFSDSGAEITQGSATASEGPTATPVVRVNGVSVPVSGPVAGTCPSCTRVSIWTAELTDDVLDEIDGLACGDTTLEFEITLTGEAYAGCATYTNSHADAVWRGQGVYPTIKPELFWDETLDGCP